MLLAAACGVLIAFPHSLLFLWTGDMTTAEITATPMVILIVGTALNGLMNLPYALQFGPRMDAPVARSQRVCPGGISSRQASPSAAPWDCRRGLALVDYQCDPRRVRPSVNAQETIGKRPLALSARLRHSAHARRRGYFCGLHYALPPMKRDLAGFIQLGTVVCLTLLATIASLPYRQAPRHRHRTQMVSRRGLVGVQRRHGPKQRPCRRCNISRLTYEPTF